MDDKFDCGEDRTIFLRDLSEAPMINGQTTSFMFGDPARRLYTIRVHGVVRREKRWQKEGGGLKEQLLLLDDTTHVLPVLIPGKIYARSWDGPMEKGEFVVFYGELQKVTFHQRQLLKSLLSTGGDSFTRLVVATEFRRIKATEDKNEKLQTLLRYEIYFEKFPLCQTGNIASAPKGDEKKEAMESKVEDVLAIVKQHPEGITMAELMAQIKVNPATIFQLQEQAEIWFDDGKFKIL